MRGDLQVIGFAQTLPRQIPASATRYVPGEPLYSDTTLGSGLNVAGSSVAVNKYILPATDICTVATDKFGGIAISHAVPFGTGTLVAHEAQASCPIPWLGRIRGRAETIASVDTETELLLLIGDVVLIDYSATGGADGGELYTIKEVGSTDAAAFEIVDGNPAKSTLDVLVDGRAYRSDITA